jgi:O-antigen/teichoic acid export membrane protein
MVDQAEMRGRLLKGATWITGARFLGNLLGLLTTLALARLLVPSDFGLVALGTTMLSVVSAITDIPMTEALVQHRGPTNEHFHTAFTLTAGRAFIIGAVFASLAWPAAALYKDHRMVNVMLVLAIGMALNGLGNPRAIMMTKALIFWQQFMLQVAQRATALIVSVGVALATHSYWALLLGSLAGQLVSVVISYTVLPFRPHISLRHFRELISFSVWLTFCQILNTLNWRLDQLLIGTCLGKPSLGYYVVGDNVAAIPTREATAPLTATIFPAFSKLAHDIPRLTAAYNRAQGLVTAVALPLGVGLALIADPLVRLAMGHRWLPAVFIIQALSSVFAISTLASLAQPLAMASGQTKMLFKRSLQVFLLRVPFIIAGMYLDGITGILYARILTGTTSILFNVNVVHRITGLTLMQQLRPNIRTLCSTAVMALAVGELGRLFPPPAELFQNFGKIAVLVPFGGLVYIGVMAALWHLSGRPRGPETEVASTLARLLRTPERRGAAADQA